ncbi:hypothetical protein [Halocalculus aciditolerans]|uniref:Uncharacterized protein n=1 Tax=Halocalculus aciditolerans TaxID=1383812 RepID=A0A830FC20_9EURY|nr:hypothetical protein [Halocalculus aciditolerans]GGL59942.1 hypothetical protein GCM10009039_17740 [Halocalculus aciditolerans]
MKSTETPATDTRITLTAELDTELNVREFRWEMIACFLTGLLALALYTALGLYDRATTDPLAAALFPVPYALLAYGWSGGDPRRRLQTLVVVSLLLAVGVATRGHWLPFARSLTA